MNRSGDRLGKMIRTTERQQIPMMAVVGAKEVEANALSVRTRGARDLESISVSEVIDKMQRAIGDRALTL